MVGSSSLENKLLDDPDAQNSSSSDKSSSSISCSICLDVVTDNGDRSTAKLHCGHQFHLDCIGSAFNVKGAMQCPNCRKIERGRWLYATGPARSLPEFHIEDWTVDEDPYELSYTEMPFRVHWCPFSGFTQVHSSFEDIDSPSAAYHDLQRYRAEHDPASSVAHSYVAYFGPLPPPPLASSNTNDIREDPNLNNSWTGLSERNEIFNPHHPLFPIVDIQYQSWDQLPPTIPLSSTNSSDQAAEVRSSLGRTARGEFRHPFPYGHGTAPGVGGSGASLFSSFAHPTINGRGGAHERRQYVSHAAIHHHQQPNNPPLRRLNNSQRGAPLVMAAAASQPDNHGRGFFLVPSPVSHETENNNNNNNSNNPSLHHHHIHHHHHPWDRDSFSRMPVISFERDPAVRGSFHRGGGFVSGSRTGGGGGGGIWQRHWP